jgi:WhiB family redox-sensing transcriptional regulator
VNDADRRLAVTLFDIAVELERRHPWRRDAACREHPELDWFPRPGRRDYGAQARAVCDGCAVRVECLAFALEHNLRDGTWGGHTFHRGQHWPALPTSTAA